MLTRGDFQLVQSFGCIVLQFLATLGDLQQPICVSLRERCSLRFLTLDVFIRYGVLSSPVSRPLSCCWQRSGQRRLHV
jgi:hypothetical protein